ncbi:FkbM family methyltransferase [Flavobacterium sp.]|uniref:FkbM family methyltransferase n=1 Tax=Flavobacterium sp. TaxID=239 RepID=UPI0028BD2D90|nr:FkbM family methyltransferase [Flavobacterium sp.]
MSLKKRIRNLIRGYGFDVIRYPHKNSFAERFSAILNEAKVDLILDVGANKGQFGKSLGVIGYKGKIMSFEPVSSVYEKLNEAAKINPNWRVYEQCCIGDHEGESVINVSNLVGNSSVLDIKSTDFNVKNSHYVAKETVKQITLATLNTDEDLIKAKNVFVKMDIQGFEHFVLSMLDKVNYNIVGFYIELSLVKLYDKQEDYLFICNLLKKYDYDLVYVEPESVRSGRMIQFNGVFLKKGLSY